MGRSRGRAAQLPDEVFYSLFHAERRSCFFLRNPFKGEAVVMRFCDEALSSWLRRTSSVYRIDESIGG